MPLLPVFLSQFHLLGNTKQDNIQRRIDLNIESLDYFLHDLHTPDWKFQFSYPGSFQWFHPFWL